MSSKKSPSRAQTSHQATPASGATKSASDTAPSGNAATMDVAAAGVSGGGSDLPFLDSIQSSFGSHDVSGVRAHQDGAASVANEQLGGDRANAYTMGQDVAFAGSPSLGVAAEEAAHAVQQRTGHSPANGTSSPNDPLEQHASRVAEAVVSGHSAEPMLDQLGGPASAPDASIQFNGEVDLDGDVDMLTLPEPEAGGTTRSELLEVSQAVDAMTAAGTLDIEVPTDEFESSRGLFHRKADYCHALYEHYSDRFRGNRVAADFAPGAQRAMEWYEQQGIEVSLVESQWSGMAGAMELSDAAWLRCVMFCREQGIDLEQMEGGRAGERQLDGDQVQDHAAALEALIGSSGAREGLGGSAFQTASNGYFDKWMELGTAFRATSSSILSSRRAANSERDDASEERLGEISAMVQVADTFGAAVSTVQGNVNALQSQVSMWQSTMTPATVHVNDNGQIAINHAEVTGPNVQENLESYIGPAANSGGAIIKFIFDAEIRRCEAAVAAVAAHDASFDRIVGNNDLKARGEALVNAMNALKTQAIAMSDEAEIMRREHLDFGARIDEENEEAGLIGAGEEQAVQYTAELATIREAATYTSNALRMSQTTRVSAVGMRDRISAYQRGRHATSDLQSAANRSNMDDEHDRYRGAWRVTQSLEGALGRRAEHLTELAAHYTDAMGNLSSTDGQDRY